MPEAAATKRCEYIEHDGRECGHLATYVCRAPGLGSIALCPLCAQKHAKEGCVGTLEQLAVESVPGRE
jgi:6-phosphofructokinase